MENFIFFAIVDRNFIETIVGKLVNKNIICNKPTAQGLDSYFIVNAKENSEVANSTIANENEISNSNISSDINKSSSNENTLDKIHADNTEKKKKKKKTKLCFLKIKINLKFFHNI